MCKKELEFWIIKVKNVIKEVEILSEKNVKIYERY